MGIDVVKDKNDIDKLLDEIKTLSKLKLVIGIFSDVGADILLRANVHEFGSAVRNIPERSFIRAGMKKHEKDIETEANKLIDLVINGKIPARTALELLGQKVVDWLKDYLTKLQSPALKPATIAKKGSANPLIDTGQMRDSITYKIE